MIQCCLNGVRSADEHAAIPVSPDEIAKAAVAATRVGAESVHLHVKSADGIDTLDAVLLAETLAAVREACPGLPVGVATGAWMQPDPRARIRDIERWRVLPDFASVNWHETGAPEVADLLVARGVGVEAGLWFPDAYDGWVAHATRDRHLRVLVELPDGLSAQSTRATAAELVARVAQASDLPILLHGEGSSAWPAVEYALAHGLDTRIGFEDTLLLPDGSPALGNDDLVRAAQVLAQNGTGPGHGR